MQIWFIVAHSHLQGISMNGQIPWRSKKDSKFMREITSAPGIKNGLLMGRKTFESIGRVLPNRETIVVTQTQQTQAKTTTTTTTPTDYLHLHTAASIHEAIQKAEHELSLDVLWIFGGATIYDQVLEDVDLCERVDGFFITTVPECDCDTFIRTNLCDFILSHPEYKPVTSAVLVLERTEDGLVELNTFSKLPLEKIHPEWKLILNRIQGIQDQDN
jgi:dihydrofolate reductase